MCVICLCASRIGLGWAHDVFLFCMSHIHAFPMHTYSLFIYLIYLNCLWLFYFSSLLLHLNLFMLVVSMAPKCKSTLARNPLRSGTSSSTDPSPSTVWFRDDDAFKVFSENFSRWGIHLECQVILLDFADIDLPSVIHSKGWESLCDVPVTCPLMLM